MYTDADIETAELVSVGNTMAKFVRPDGRTWLTGGSRTALVEAIAQAAWNGDSVVEALTDELYERNLVVTDELFYVLIDAGMGVYRQREAQS